ncbi:MAG: hypothetical protein ABRQ26_04230 [Syntrophomonadaceae bacterium]
MPIWLYCQSCQQWSKSDASLSNDKTCPFCSNLYISMKPVIDSNPYKVKVENIEPQSDLQPAEAGVNTAAEDAAEGPDSAEPDVNESEPPEEPVKEESAEQTGKSEMFDFVEILETSKTSGPTRKTPEEDEEKAALEEEQLSAVPEAVREEASQLPATGGEPEKPLHTPVIQVGGKASEPDGPETTETDDKTRAGVSGDTPPRKKRFKSH